jgi:hypothetical protein
LVTYSQFTFVSRSSANTDIELSILVDQLVTAEVQLEGEHVVAPTDRNKEVVHHQQNEPELVTEVRQLTGGKEARRELQHGILPPRLHRRLTHNTREAWISQPRPPKICHCTIRNAMTEGKFDCAAGLFSEIFDYRRTKLMEN